MATVEYWYRTANSFAGLPYGPVTASGAPDGSQLNPWSAFVGGGGDVQALAQQTGRSNDDLILYFHPACVFTGATTGTYDSWLNVGQGTGWRSVTLKRWEDIVTAQPLYADWLPSIDCTQTISSGDWTQGSISAGVWSAGSGDVYRCTIANTTTTSNQGLRWGTGHVVGNNVVDYAVIGTYCQTLALVTEVADYELTSDGGTGVYLYVKTGVVGTNPTTLWGSFSVVAGAVFQTRSCKNVTFENFQLIGVYQYSYHQVDGDVIEGMTWRNFSVQFAPNSGAIRVAADNSTPNSATRNLRIYNPNLRALEPPRMDKASGSPGVSRGSQNGINIDSVGTDGVVITNPKIQGFSHGQIQVFAHTDEPNPTLFPRNVWIYVDDDSDGKGHLIGGPNYQRGLNLRISRNGLVSGIRLSQMTCQSQICGDIIISSPFYDDTNPPFSDPFGSDNNNVGLCINAFLSQYGHSYTTQKVRIFGAKFDIANSYALCWLNGVPEGMYIMRGSLIRDSGLVRYWPQASTAEAGYLRRRAPILAHSQGTTAVSSKQVLKDNFIIPSINTEGMAQWHPFGGSVTTVINETTWPIVAFDDTVQWGPDFVGGNQQNSDPAAFGFDADLNYIGPRLTPVQTTARPGRGYL